MNTLITILLSGSLSAGLLLALGYVCRNWFLERLKGSIKYEYDQKIEGIKHDYSQKLEKLKVELQSESNATKDKQKAELEHDKQVFERLNNIVSEPQFRKIVGGIANYSYYYGSGLASLEYLQHAGEHVQNRFLNPLLQQKFGEVTTRLLQLIISMGFSFFPSGTPDILEEQLFEIYPENKHFPRDSKEYKVYDDARKRTEGAAVELMQAYDDFRNYVKDTLFV